MDVNNRKHYDSLRNLLLPAIMFYLWGFLSRKPPFSLSLLFPSVSLFPPASLLSLPP